MSTSRPISNPPSKTPRPKTGLVRSAASARREASVLRRGRERLEEEPRADETSARTSIAARRSSSA